MRPLQAFRETGLATHGPHGIGSANNGTPRMHTTRHAPPPETFMSGAITPRTSTPLSMSICSIQVRWPLSWPRSRSQTQVRRDVMTGHLCPPSTQFPPTVAHVRHVPVATSSGQRCFYKPHQPRSIGHHIDQRNRAQVVMPAGWRLWRWLHATQKGAAASSRRLRPERCAHY